ncbi:tRNA (adenosine(37)-N6)-dimethylallyltransferase MiaA [Virgibacillus sp. 179-BFC.A HS]|uniref:tRNA dimethylallyltransferase n=1 Tax=Tigheibacillus jepli TaxID=3035914 RepID=A0ABU5CJV8_9BACI|nr:tRNA (adenosine(37)-N6)-dimethylallyltransferase MiaA [Virgibacillus sp. 179-BFC.A HS]MDY0405803.1 tRNA (adenosine(37)-N6)-dimethylallyltransferase MiaA [Virgibacillus sp. 179-BFC.A HS]
MKQKVIAIVGPTAVGKSDLGIALAKRLNGEIISGDSMQIYKGMDIGTAKITKDGQQGVKHYMIDIKEPWESFSVADFQELVRKYIHVIAQKGKVPILVGGSGLYIQAALFDYHFSEQKRDTTFTEKMEEQIEKRVLRHFIKN